MSRTDRFPPLSVDAELTLTVDGHEYRVRDRGNRLVVDAPTLPAALALRDSLPEGGVGRLLSTTDLAVDVAVHDAVVATTGPSADGPVATTVGGSPTTLRPAGLATALVREGRARPVATAALVAALLALGWLVGRVIDAFGDD
ncbi:MULTISPECIES: hypothetical protein [Halomicrobium]|uniref:Uncharacterized protein n=2 Tax=Halomicrobium mukohataei TaxID=57705 RepID=C7NWK4_HALMD|nr:MULTISPECIES: hypothetical protein [Halomicrobium]ACV48214.1 conserved hypothetical protein [Halomicrobium mukohataei DSM 12286]QCD66636.1 hypothetical protein E5139_13650 [Halomicrobium mukohataei]QFR21442.1 hypothetical protein GBQ70_13665 [Halomicrobium sp. ZPS1]